MAKILILLTCLVGFVAAGVLDTRWMRNGRTNDLRIGLDNRDIDVDDVDRISRMTGTELVRQRILLMLLDRVQETLDDVDLRNIRDEFVVSEGNYRGGLDDDMLYVIELQQNGRLLGKRDVFTIVKQDHKRQMIGLKRLLSCAIDFDTFVQNALTARNRMNGVLFVNALLLAVRERDDTRNLIVPAICDILPELYVDRNTLRTLVNIDLNLLTSRSGYDTRRPNLMDMLGVNGRMERNGRWGQLGNLVTLNRNRLDGGDKIVIDEVNGDTKQKTMKLLTEDVGFKGFLQNLINDICLKENELDRSKTWGRDRFGGLNIGIMTSGEGRLGWQNTRNQMLDNDRGEGRLGLINWKNQILDNDREEGRLGWQNTRNQMLDNGRGEGRLGWMNRKNRMLDDVYGENVGIYGRKQLSDRLFEELPTTTIDDERLLHVNGKKISSLTGNNRWGSVDQKWNMRDRFYNVMAIDDGRRIKSNSDGTDLNRLNEDCVRCIDRQSINDCNKCLIRVNDDVLDRLSSVCKKCIRVSNDYDCDKCREQIGISGIGLGRDDDKIRRRGIVDGRRTTNIGDVSGVLNNDDVNRLNSKCIKCIERKTVDDCNKCEWVTDDDVIDRLGQNCKKCIRDVNDYDCDKCQQKLNLGTRNGDRLNDWDVDRNRNTRDRLMDVLLKRSVDEGRRTKYTNDVNDMRRGLLSDDVDINRLNTNCRQCIDRKTMRDCDMCLRTIDDDVLDRLDKDCKKCIRDVNDSNCDKCQTKIINGRINRNRFGDDDLNWSGVNVLGVNRRLMGNNGLGVDVLDVMDGRKSTKSEILLHNLRQVLARINLERISLGLDSTDDIIGDIRGIGANGRGMQRLIDIVNTKIVRKLQNVKNGGRMTDIDVDRLIAKALIERGGDVNILDILTDVILQNVDVQGDMQIVRDIGDALNDEKVLKVLRQVVKTVDRARTEILGGYKRDELELDEVQINDIVVDKLVTRLQDKDIDLRNLVGDSNKVVVVRQQQLTHNDFTIKMDVDSKRNQRVVVRTLIGPKRIDDVGRELTLNERRLGFMLLDTNVVDLDAGRNIIQLRSRDLVWTQRDTTTLTQIYKRVMMAERDIGTTYGNDVVIGQDCRFPQRLILPRGRVDGLDLELLVIITRYEGAVNLRDDTTTKCGMGISVKGVDNKSLGFPLDRQIDDVRDLRALKNVVGVDIKIYQDDRKSLSWW